jgi:hypothetical protein
LPVLAHPRGPRSPEEADERLLWSRLGRRLAARRRAKDRSDEDGDVGSGAQPDRRDARCAQPESRHDAGIEGGIEAEINAGIDDEDEAGVHTWFEKRIARLESTGFEARDSKRKNAQRTSGARL